MSEQANLEPLTDAELGALKMYTQMGIDDVGESDQSRINVYQFTFRLIAEIESRRRFDDKPFTRKQAITGEISNAKGGGILGQDTKALDSCDENGNG